MMRRLLCITFISAMVCLNAEAKTLPVDSDLGAMAVRNLFFTDIPLQSDIITSCAKAEESARIDMDYRTVFRIENMAINAMCLDGDLDGATRKVDKMCKSARSMNDSVGMVLSLESLGVIYLYSNFNKQALEMFDEAERYMGEKPHPQAEISLLMLQIQANLNVERFADAFVYISRAHRLLQINDIQYHDIYKYYIDCYSVIFNMHSFDSEVYGAEFEKLMNTPVPQGASPKWLDYVAYRYYIRTGQDREALQRCISAFEYNQNKSIRAYVYSVEASLLEKEGNYKGTAEALKSSWLAIQQSADNQHLGRIDSLMVAYRAEMLMADNQIRTDNLLNRMLLLLLIIVVVLALVFLVMHRRLKSLRRVRVQLIRHRKLEVESVKSQEKLISTMSNELRAPLNAIVGFSSILDESGDVNETMREECARYIIQNSEQLLDTINQIIEVNDYQKDGIRFTNTECDIVALCTESMSALRGMELIKRNAINTNMTAQPNSIEMNIDPEYFKRVLDNLLTNAAKFTMRGVIMLSIKVDERTGKLVMVVQDTGCGIPADKYEYVFGSYSKLSDHIPGIGIGLTVSRLIVEQMGGTIEIDPQYTAGTKIIVVLPMNSGKKQ